MVVKSASKKHNQGGKNNKDIIYTMNHEFDQQTQYFNKIFKKKITAKNNSSKKNPKSSNRKNGSGELSDHNKDGKLVTILKRFFQYVIIPTLYVSLFLGFLYIVDYEKFSQFKSGTAALIDKVIGLLPEGVVTYGRKFFKFLTPLGETVVNTGSNILSQTSNFLSTNPLVKDHWLNVKEISSICGARMVDYMRTLYLQITGFCLSAKKKIF